MSNNKIIAVVDYGLGNLFSITKALSLFTDTSVVTDDAQTLLSADAVIIPGVGAFAVGMEGLLSRGLVDPLKQIAGSGRPILGICLGAQLMLETGFEFGEHKGLGIIPGRVERFSPQVAQNMKIPHVGWNTLSRPKAAFWKGTILEGLRDEEMVYFVHSYIMIPDNPLNSLGQAEYGGHEFCAVTKHENVYGTQFHPEKSGETGLRIIHNFIRTIQ